MKIKCRRCIHFTC